MKRRSFVGACLALLAFPFARNDADEPYLRTCWVWNDNRKDWKRCRMHEIRKGQIISIQEDDSEGNVQYVDDTEWWEAVGNAKVLPPPTMCQVEVRKYAG